MDCERFREALSARLDGEDPGIDAAVLDRHLTACSRCRHWNRDVAALNRAVRITAAEAIPDLTPDILAALGREAPPARRWRYGDVVRVGLVLVAGLQLFLAGSDLFLSTERAEHVVHELGVFDLALAVGFLGAAWRPTRAYGMLPLLAALATGLAATAAVDTFEGRAVMVTEANHLLEIAGFSLVWLLTRRSPYGSAGRLLPTVSATPR
jgi:predicted anti-sigma-YlaC factor YlaD